MNRATPGRLIPFHRCGPAQNMAIDQMLLESVEMSRQPTLRLYGWSEPTLSLGYFQSREDRLQHTSSGDLAVVRRATGGGAIVHHHELTYSIAVPIDPKSLGVNQALYRQVHEAMIDSLAELSIYATTFRDSGACRRGECPFLCFMRRSDDDLVVHGYKVLGSAQRKSRGAVLQHGSLLIRASQFAPELPGISELTGQIFTIDQIAERFSDQIQRKLSVDFTVQPLTDSEQKHATDISVSRFGSDKWIGRR
jgi:lipoate-protein ligase A